MKRLLLSATLLAAVVGGAFAQKKVVREAKAALSNKNYTEARDLINKALTDPETENDQEAWKVAGDIANAVFDQETTKAMMQQKHDQKAMYEALLGTVKPYFKADELGQVPDEKGKVKNRVRKDVANVLRANLPHFINAGIFYYDNKDYPHAADAFEAYTVIPFAPMFQGEKLEKLGIADSTLQQMKHYAAISAIQAEDSERSIRILKNIIENPFTPNSASKEHEAYEFLAQEYLMKKKDTISALPVLESGAKKFPTNKFFLPQIINIYIGKGQGDKALAYLDQALVTDPANACQLLSVKASIMGEQNKFDEADKLYEEALKADANCERALEGLAVSYIVQAQNLKEIASKAASRKEQTEKDAQVKALYAKSLPLLEKYKSALLERRADDEDVKGALMKLRNVYYNLNKDTEFKAVEAELKARGIQL